jgi:hypothetical protein
MSAQANPYLAPKANVDDGGGASAEVESIRREHLSHEASIKSIGLLHYLSSVFLMLGAVAAIVGQVSGTANAAALGVLMLFVALGVGLFLVARGLRQLRPWVRVPATILSLLGLAAAPLGTLISIYALWLIHSRKGRLILSPEYGEILEATPHIKYRTPVWVWVVLALVLATVGWFVVSVTT